MNCTRILSTAVVATALILAAVPVGAQRGGGDDKGQKKDRGRAAASGPAQQGAGARQAVPRSSGGRQSARGEGGGRQSGGGQTAQGESGGRQAGGGQTARGEGGGRQSAGGRDVSRGSGGGQVDQRAMPRADDRFQSPGHRMDGRPGYGPQRGSAGRNNARAYSRPGNFVPYRPFHFSQPYYSFRARLNFGFGLWLGYTVPYPWSWYGNRYRPRIYGNGFYYPGNSYYAEPGMLTFGGLSFDIQPADADLYVDGEYVGPVGTFTPYGEPLTLAPGVHAIAIVRDGYRTMEWDVTVEAGQVLPFRGAMEPW
jgi:hypothetical protein